MTGANLQIVWEGDGLLSLCVGIRAVILQCPLGGGCARDQEGGPWTPVLAPILHVVGHRMPGILQVHPATAYNSAWA